MDSGKQTEYQIDMAFPLKSKETADITHCSHFLVHWTSWLMMGFNMNSTENGHDFVQNWNE